MKIRAAVLHDAHKPFEIMELDLDAPSEGEVLIRSPAGGSATILALQARP